jgi:hypothetical protein
MTVAGCNGIVGLSPECVAPRRVIRRSWWNPAGPSRVNVYLFIYLDGTRTRVRSTEARQPSLGMHHAQILPSGPLSDAAKYPAGARPSKCIIIIAGTLTSKEI